MFYAYTQVHSNIFLTKLFRVIKSALFAKDYNNNINTTGTADTNAFTSPEQGKVSLVGAGPGDAELLTLKAYNALQKADVVLIDWLVNPDILEMIPANVEQIFVGKKCGQHSMSQHSICQLMVNLAKQGKNLVRLKGGDPAIFARSAEECEALTNHHIEFTIIPGITAASGASAYAGIPLTHRDCAQSVRFVTAHLKQLDETKYWPQLQCLNSNETLVIYMGLNKLADLTQHLLNLNMPANMPAAVVDQATLSAQQICIGELANIAELVAEQAFAGPAIIIIGDVVSKRVKVNKKFDDIMALTA
ncbi:uroporphyrinogen-III C-methyltransferase [Aliiglaciecola sp. LCG003]|uniref:uroporphyrinogen-III C-methyltransferase n=1 Tax=Aliiglaciecola sp. LCG003 TaxID=3053655 RepID=UPI0025725928|nr:uroporphyrinogen-III C-methyltransferase [Aliiglaciecola sp. LCG003]WJG11102.1 uroporphyrinogen-III C-methyltransferase [Aliiglaciecola sp. LCG003]